MNEDSVNEPRRPSNPTVAQPDFIYFECPECGFDSVQRADFKGSYACPLCAGDSGHDVGMRHRTARESDKPEGRDARKASVTPPAAGKGEQG